MVEKLLTVSLVDDEHNPGIEIGLCGNTELVSRELAHSIEKNFHEEDQVGLNLLLDVTARVLAGDAFVSIEKQYLENLKKEISKYREAVRKNSRPKS